MNRSHRLLAISGLVLAFALGTTGCFNPFNPLVSEQRAASTPAPAPSSPTNVIQLFSWCWSHRDPSLYPEIFTSDYRFIFAPNDSAGNAYRNSPWLRDDEISMATHMFTGGLDIPPASNITIAIDNPLLVQTDPRPGMDPRLHRSIRTTVNLQITFESGGTSNVNSVVGSALFYLVRGDAPGIIPTDLAAKGFKPDSTRWWIERWEDETAGASGSPASLLRPGTGTAAAGRTARPYGFTLPPGRVSFGELKAAYF